MSSQPCSSQDFLEVNQNKEYTLIATSILESVLTDARLNAQSIKLWQILFNQARYNPNFDIKISYSYLSKKLGKSTRTIARYVETLQNAGYLIVTHNFDKNGGQRPSTISVRVPEFSIQHANNKKDRLNKNKSDNNSSLIKIENNTTGYLEAPKYNHETSPVDVTGHVTSSLNNNVLHGTNEESLFAEETTQVAAEITPINEAHTVTQSNQNDTPQDKTVMGGYDIYDIQKENNKKDINKNNNNNVVVSNSENQIKLTKIQGLQDEIKQIKNRLTKGNEELLHIKDHALMYDQMRKNSELEASLHLARIALERLHKEIEDNKVEVETTQKIMSDRSFMSSKTGVRSLPEFTFKRLVKSLRCYGYEGNVLNSLINEIVFEVRFGSLINCNRTKDILSTDNAINIALKLVREKRWTTPVLFKKYATTINVGNMSN